MNKYIALHNHSHFSTQDSINQPKHIISRMNSLGMDTIAISDHGNLGGVVTFLDAFKKENKRLIAGCELYLSEFAANIRNENNRKNTHLVVLANGDQGWENLLKIVSQSNHPDNFYYKPRLSLEEIAPYSKNIIAIAGHLGSCLAHEIVDRDCVVLPNGLENGIVKAEQLRGIFGENFYLECQLIDEKCRQLVEVIREIGKRTGIPCVATPDAHYSFPEQIHDHQVLVATNLRKSIMECSNPDFAMSTFFAPNHYYIPSYDELLKWGNTEEELENTLVIAEKCKNYTTILRQPIPPPFQLPTTYDKTHDDYLREKCWAAFDKKFAHLESEKLKIYRDRLRDELDILVDSNLSTYFLLIADVLDYAREIHCLTSPGRGSAAGSLASYLLQITQIDPIEHGLIFERFYNAARCMPPHVEFDEFPFEQFDKTPYNGDITEFIQPECKKIIENAIFKEELKLLGNRHVRAYYYHLLKNVELDQANPQNSYIMWACGKVDEIDIKNPPKINPGNVSMPDIDVDFAASKRGKIVEYIKNKYGEKHVAQLVTFQRMKGRAAIKNVLRAHNVVSASEMNAITEDFPMEGKITDELQEMKDETGESSIILWTLQNDKKGKLRNWCYIDENGELKGSLAKYFEQAIRLEGCISAQSKHPAGIVISPPDIPIDKVCPMSYDSKDKQLIAGFEMRDIEKIGLIKYDLLSLSLLDKLAGICNILKYGTIIGEE
jgi:DNA polymerase III alpha subunit